jgi:hypothetical protein
VYNIELLMFRENMSYFRTALCGGWIEEVAMMKKKEDYMKKLLILMLVLGFATAASADTSNWGLRVAPGGTLSSPESAPDYNSTDWVDPAGSSPYYEINVNDLLWIGLYNGQAGEAGDTREPTMYITFPTDNNAVFQDGTYTQYVPPLGGAIDDQNAWEDWGGWDGYTCDTSDGNPATYNGVGILVAVRIQCTTVDETVTVELQDESLNLMDSVTIAQVPEPATVGLLSLGGLFLLRRRKK